MAQMIKIVSRKGPGDQRWTQIKAPQWEPYSTTQGRRQTASKPKPK